MMEVMGSQASLIWSLLIYGKKQRATMPSSTLLLVTIGVVLLALPFVLLVGPVKRDVVSSREPPRHEVAMSGKLFDPDAPWTVRAGAQNMAGYILVDVEITDPEKYREYTRVVPQTLSAFGGRFLVRGGKAENLEGDWQPRRVVVLEFESVERAKAWWSSEDYRAPRELRRSASITNMIVVEGV
jgi:uncharacterized protein (DUF1330 family)